MADKLVIVESPAKANTIKKFLGGNTKVVASMGHIRDLPKSKLGVDIEHDFEPEYINIRGKGDLIKSLKTDAKKAKKVYLATDPDREGEAIAWHLAYILKDEKNKISRVTFNEITKNAVQKAIKEPRNIDMNVVDAQQARRVLDRIVGYKMSPLLWKKVKRGLSAGRVQSVAVKLIVDRENEIEVFMLGNQKKQYKKAGEFLGKYELLEFYTEMQNKDYQILGIPEMQYSVDQVKEIFDDKYIDSLKPIQLAILNGFWQNRFTKEAMDFGEVLFIIDTLNGWDNLPQLDLSEEEMKIVLQWISHSEFVGILELRRMVQIKVDMEISMIEYIILMIKNGIKG
mgnify:CR=1 FL=1